MRTCESQRAIIAEFSNERRVCNGKLKFRDSEKAFSEAWGQVVIIFKFLSVSSANAIEPFSYFLYLFELFRKKQYVSLRKHNVCYEMI